MVVKNESIRLVAARIIDVNKTQKLSHFFEKAMCYKIDCARGSAILVTPS